MWLMLEAHVDDDDVCGPQIAMVKVSPGYLREILARFAQMPVGATSVAYGDNHVSWHYPTNDWLLESLGDAEGFLLCPERPRGLDGAHAVEELKMTVDNLGNIGWSGYYDGEPIHTSRLTRELVEGILAFVEMET